MLATQLRHIDYLEEEIARWDEEVKMRKGNQKLLLALVGAARQSIRKLEPLGYKVSVENVAS